MTITGSDSRPHSRALRDAIARISRPSDATLSENSWHKLRNQLQARTDLLSLIASTLGGKPLSGVYFPCPFGCAPDVLMFVDTRHQTFFCDRCGWQGDAAAFVSLYRKIPVTEALKVLGRLSGLTVPVSGEQDYENLSKAIPGARPFGSRLPAPETETILDQGKLYVRKNGTLFSFGAWPQIRAMRKIPGGSWENIDECEPDLLALVNGSWQVMAWLESSPAIVRETVMNSQAGCYCTLRFLALTGNAGMDLCSTGGDFWMAAIIHARTLGVSIPPEEYLRFALMKRTDIAGILGFPPTKQMVKIASKIDITSFRDLSYLVSIRELAKIPEAMKLLSHAGMINAAIIPLLINDMLRPYLTGSLIEEVAVDHGTDNEIPMRLCRLHRVWTEIHPATPLPALRSLYQADALETRLGISPDLDSVSFPESPIATPNGIVHINCGRALRREGKRRRNCVGGYVHEAESGRSYFYTVTKPEFATLRIAQDENTRRWKIVQIKAVCNSAVKPETLEYVKSWLDEVNGKSRTEPAR